MDSAGPTRPGPAADPAEGSLPAPGEAGFSPQALGRHIRYIRVSLGLTLRDLEKRGQISAAHLSEIERGNATPTIRSLGRIAEALGISASSILEFGKLPVKSVGRAGERADRVLRWGEGTLEPLTEQADGTTIGTYLLLLPVRPEPALHHAHPGEEWLTLLSGSVEMTVGGRTFPLQTGESLHFHSQEEHSYRNLGAEAALLLVACRPRLTI